MEDCIMQYSICWACSLQGRSRSPEVSKSGGPETCHSFARYAGRFRFWTKMSKELGILHSIPALIFSRCFCVTFRECSRYKSSVPISGFSDWETFGKETLRLFMAALSGQTAISSSLQRQTLHLCCPYLKSRLK